jgi:hypothetical protein
MQTGIIIVGIAIVCLMAFGMQDFFTNPGIHLGLRVGVGAIGGGILTLVIINIRNRLRQRRAGTQKETEEE